ncbi:3-oxoacyl-(acyl-carrier-protein) synthase III [Aequitasia blattaphilus]|uniref:Beta-ketoacyl-[acyl-carrier-protein] synthase III n=1 Tax=Aequitasia blattaphilus TaxID=2949332 RepID=A0ABT1E7S6_9FIRM|nr:beta-ketoacyl-ACP synthase III [Aequitasia blattaphilus]MCP1101879.1 ketoacyl-ACP synthase III [Aequitasia blattaphilus]MCR8614519.1 ketoacyl-ACP synthase III [Aequitasia blattaphilus]
MVGKIKGTGSYTPQYRMDNNELSTMVETSDEWIRERTGVVARHIAKEETNSEMASKAGENAMKNAKVDPLEVDLVIVATNSPEVQIPSIACLVQDNLGLKNATCYDLVAACSGFVYAYNAGLSYIISKMYKCILVIGSEALSTIVDWSDRGTCILFGDGAGAVVLKEEEGNYYLPATHTDGSKHNSLKLYPKESPYVQMDGGEVFKFAVSKVPTVVEEVLEKNQVEKSEIKYYVLHQANKRIVESVAKRLKEPMEKFPMNVMEYGNTSAASVPILLDEINQKGMLEKGDKIVIAGFGGGLTWGASIITW